MAIYFAERAYTVDIDEQTDVSKEKQQTKPRPFKVRAATRRLLRAASSLILF